MLKRPITSGAALFAAIFMIAGCENRDNTALVADTELQSAIDVSRATFVVTDVLQICGFAGKKVYLDHF